MKVKQWRCKHCGLLTVAWKCPKPKNMKGDHVCEFEEKVLEIEEE